MFDYDKHEMFTVFQIPHKVSVKKIVLNKKSCSFR